MPLCVPAMSVIPKVSFLSAMKRAISGLRGVCFFSTCHAKKQEKTAIPWDWEISVRCADDRHVGGE